MNLRSFLCNLLVLAATWQQLNASGVPHQSQCLVSPQGIPCFTVPADDEIGLTLIPLGSAPTNAPTLSWQYIFENPETTSIFFTLQPQSVTAPGYAPGISYAIGFPWDPTVFKTIVIINPLCSAQAEQYISNPASYLLPEQFSAPYPTDYPHQAADSFQANPQKETPPVKVKTVKKKLKKIEAALEELQKQKTLTLEDEKKKSIQTIELQLKKASLLSTLSRQQAQTASLTSSSEKHPEMSDSLPEPHQTPTLPAASASLASSLVNPLSTPPPATKKKASKFTPATRPTQPDTLPTHKLQQALYLARDTAATTEATNQTTASCPTSPTNSASSSGTQTESSTPTLTQSSSSRTRAHQGQRTTTKQKSKKACQDEVKAFAQAAAANAAALAKLATQNTEEIARLEAELEKFNERKPETLDSKTLCARASWIKAIYSFIGRPHAEKDLKMRAFTCLTSSCETDQEFEKCLESLIKNCEQLGESRDMLFINLLRLEVNKKPITTTPNKSVIVHLKETENLLGVEKMKQYPDYYDLKGFVAAQESRLEDALAILDEGLARHGSEGNELLIMKKGVLDLQKTRKNVVENSIAQQERNLKELTAQTSIV